VVFQFAILSFPPNDLVCRYSGHEHPLFGSPDHGALPGRSCEIAGAANHSLPAWRCTGALFHAGLASEASLLVTRHQAKGQNAEMAVLIWAVFACWQMFMFEAPCWRGWMGVGAATRSLVAAHVHTDDGPQWMASGGFNAFQGLDFLMLKC